MAARIDTTRDAHIELVAGSSGSGKSWHVKQAIAKAKRVCVWDPDDEYGPTEHDKGITLRVTSIAELCDWLHRYPAGPLKIRYVGAGKERFNLWAKAVFAWGNCVAVAEEIAGTTSPGKAGPGWHTLLSRGRKRGLVVYGVTQRPAESDKTIAGNATVIHVGRLSKLADRKAMAAELDCCISVVTALKPLEWLERYSTGELYRGKMGQKGRELLTRDGYYKPAPVTGTAQGRTR